MRTVPLGELARVVSGGTPRSGVAEYWDGEIPWATPTDLSQLAGTVLSHTARCITEAGLSASSATVLPVGSVLLTSRAAIGHVAINSLPVATNQGFKSIVPGERLAARYLLHWLRANRSLLQSLGNGATFKELSRETVERLRVPCPEMAEQLRIAAILDQADALRVKRNVASQYESLIGAKFNEMFGNPDEASQTQAFSSVATLVAGKSLVGTMDDKNPVRILKISAVTSGTYRPNESKPLPSEYVPSEGHLVKPNDLLMSRANTAELVGAVAFVDGPTPPVVVPDKIWRFIWRDKRSMPAYYAALLRHPTMRRKISALASGSGGSMKNVSKAKLDQMHVPVVPFDQQRLFAEHLAAIRRVQQTAMVGIRELDELFASLQSRAFRGEL